MRKICFPYKRMISMLLVLICMLGLLPTAALAADAPGSIKMEDCTHNGVHYESPSLGTCWLHQMTFDYNQKSTIGFCAEHLPAIRPLRPQASFLVWLDCRGLGLRHEELQRLFIDEARLALNDGALFGREGEGFMRLNVGAPRAVVREALERLRDAVARTVK